MHEFFNLGGGGKAFAADWYVVSGDTGNQIKYYQASTPYNVNNWSSANSSTNTANDLNTFLDNTVQDGDTVYIKAGTYKLSSQISLTSKVLHLYGGFAGTETTSSDRNSATGTTLDAQKQNYIVLPIFTNSTVDGFTITGGNHTGNNSTGGGIFISGSPTITNCTITGNNATDYGGGIWINGGSPTIANCTITGNNAGNGGGIYIGHPQAQGGTLNPTITNCTIVNNTASTSNGKEIYFSGGSTTLRNTLIWNADTNNAINGNGAHTYNNCAYPSATGTGNIALNAWNSPVSSDVTVKGVTHKVYKIFDNYSALQGIIGNGSPDVAPAYDQIGKAFANPPSIGAAEYDPPVLSVDISGDSEISTSYGTAKTLTFAPTVSLDNVALTTGYTVSWDIAVSPTASTISIDQSGKLTIGATTPAGSYDVTVKAKATYTEITMPVIKSNIAEKKVNITVESGDINLTLTSKDLPSGKVGTVYSEDQYFTATATPSSADITWTIEGLPKGLSFDKGKISGTPTKLGNFTVKAVVSAKLKNYNDASKDVQFNITVESGDMTLTLTQKTLPNGKVNTAYTGAQYFTATVEPSSADLTWSVEGLPAGLSFNKGTISGTPTKAGNFTVKASVSAKLENYNDASKDVQFNITVESGDMTLTLTQKTLPNGKVNTAYTGAQYFTATVDPSSADIAWKVEGLPAGLSFNEGTISGTPTASGDFSVKVTVTATLANYTTASKNVTASLKIEAADTATESGDITLTLTQKTLPNGKVNTAYTEAQYFTATATPSSAALAWKVEGLPAGLSFNEGKISGTPTASGDFSVKVTVTATLANYTTASKNVTASLKIEAADTATPTKSRDITLTLTQKTLPNGKVNTAYTEAQYFTATATPSSAALAWNVEGLPAGLSFNEGKISGTPTASGDFSVKVTVTATLANYTTASKNITASLKIEAADKQDEQDKQDEEEQKEEENTKTDSDLDKMTPEEKKQVKSITFTDLSNLEYISKNSADFSNLKTVKISSDAVISNNGELDLSVLPATVTNFSISGNSSVKSLNLKESKVANIDASGCVELKSVDVSGNTSIVTLNVSGTKIKFLDASNCSNLTSIDCSYCLLSELNVEASNALKSINCSHNSLLVLDIPSGLANLASVDCISQELGNWRSVVSFNFDDFSESPDIIPSEDNTASASSIVRLSATKLSKVTNLKAYNKSGDIIPIIASDDNGNITFASAPDIMTYDYNIGFNNQVMDVTVYSDGSSYSTDTLSSSGGGCSLIRNEGLGIRNVLILLLLFVLAPLKIKKI